MASRRNCVLVALMLVACAGGDPTIAAGEPPLVASSPLDDADAGAAGGNETDACAARGGHYEYTTAVSYLYVGRGVCQSFAFATPLRKCIYSDADYSVSVSDQCTGFGTHRCSITYDSRVRIAPSDTTECTVDFASGNCFATVRTTEVDAYTDSAWGGQC